MMSSCKLLKHYMHRPRNSQQTLLAAWFSIIKYLNFGGCKETVIKEKSLRPTLVMYTQHF